MRIPVFLLLLLLAAPAAAEPRFPAVTEAELALIFEVMARDWLEESPIGDETRDRLTSRYYRPEHAQAYAAAITHGLAERGVETTDPHYGDLQAYLTATVFQQSSGQPDALSTHGREGEPVGEDVGAYQLRRGTARSQWRKVYPDRPYPKGREAETAALIDYQTAAPLWVNHALDARRTCDDLLRQVTPEKLRRVYGRPPAYCKKPRCPLTVSCWLIRERFGVGTTNGNATNVIRWGDRYERALETIRADAGEG